MDVDLLSALIGIVAGAFGYWFTTFIMQPILRFRELRNKVLKDFIYYAQVINADGLNDEMQKLFQERILENRRSSAELLAATQDLPSWYLSYLKYKKYDPSKAAQSLIGFSNTYKHNESHVLESSIRKQLGLPEMS